VIGPRTPQQRRRYLRHKVIAILVTFVLVYGAIRLFAPRGHLVESLESLVLRSPEQAFEQRVSGEMVHALAVREAGPDSAGFSFRTLDGHPFTLRADSLPAGTAIGDTLVIRGAYTWSSRGGAVDPRGTGPESEGGERAGFVRPAGS
jgi:hypothetical protein